MGWTAISRGPSTRRRKVRMSARARATKREVIRARDYAAYRATAHARGLAKRPVELGGRSVPDGPIDVADDAAVQAVDHDGEVASA